MQDKGFKPRIGSQVWEDLVNIHKILYTLISLPSRTYLPFVIIGIVNRLLPKFRSLFYCYAGSRAYTETYVPKSLVSAFRWFPVPIALLQQNGEYGLVVASPLSEGEFLDPTNSKEFARLQKRLGFIAWILNVDQVNLAGILPGVVDRYDLLKPRDTREITTNAVWGAVKRLIDERFNGKTVPVVVIGGAGRIGLTITDHLSAKGFEVHILDPRRGTECMPKALVGHECLVVDVSRKGVINKYIGQMWAGMVVLNEVFPRPARGVARKLEAKGIEYWHLSGLSGWIVPPLPHGYENAVPCCAAHSADETPEVVLIRLNREIDRVQLAVA